MAQLSLNKNYISVYDGVFSEGSCDKLIHFFETNKDKSKETDLGFCKFRELPFSISPQNESNVAKVLKPYVQRYKKDNNISDYVWPERYKMEGIRFKKYMPNSGDGFEEHADAVNIGSCTRFLVMFVYLSNNKIQVSGEACCFQTSIHRPDIEPTWTSLSPSLLEKLKCGLDLIVVFRRYVIKNR